MRRLTEDQIGECGVGRRGRAKLRADACGVVPSPRGGIGEEQRDEEPRKLRMQAQALPRDPDRAVGSAQVHLRLGQHDAGEREGGIEREHVLRLARRFGKPAEVEQAQSKARWRRSY